MDKRYGVLLSPAAWEQPQVGKVLSQFAEDGGGDRCVYCDHIDDSIIPGFVTLIFSDVSNAEASFELMLPAHLIMCVVHGPTDTKIGF